MTSPNPVILLKDLSFGYDEATPVVERINAGLQPAKVTALVGPNAAGKTTLIKLMLGLLKPWSGAAELDGRAIHDVAAPTRALSLAYVPQRHGVRFGFTVREVVAMGAHAADGRAASGDIERAIREADLDAIADRVFTRLSGGQQQRVMLARAEVQSARTGRAMLLDEPGSHLDLQHRHAMMRRLGQLAARGLAVLVVLHDLDLAVRYADEAWLMHDGKLVAEGAWDAVLRPDRLGPVYGIEIERIEREHRRPLLAVVGENGDTMTMSPSAMRQAK
ncbi:MAG: ABC transporter ATP-binding protein [Phycisphaeraceae bacterium]